MKIELTKEQAKHIFKCIADQDNNVWLCDSCEFGKGEDCLIRDDNEVDILHAAARVLYGTKQKLDRVEIAKDFMGSMLSNDIIEIGKSNHEGIVKLSFMYADAFIEASEKEKTK